LEAAMIRKKILDPNRLRRIDGGFSFIPHRFLTGGFLASLHQKEFLLYFFLVLASDRHGLSYYAYDSICSLLRISLDQYIEARNSLIDKDLIAFDGTLFQVLSLPDDPVLNSAKPLGNKTEMTSGDSVAIQQLIRNRLGENYLS
jgi:hypothetical protein